MRTTKELLKAAETLGSLDTHTLTILARDLADKLKELDDAK